MAKDELKLAYKHALALCERLRREIEKRDKSTAHSDYMDLSRWIAADWRDLPTVTACYAIYLSGKLVYIGRAANLRTRFHTHQIASRRIAYRSFDGKPEDVTVKYLECKRGRLDDIESDLIQHHCPSFNRQKKAQK